MGDRHGGTANLDLPHELFVIVPRDLSPVAQWNMKLGQIASAGAAFAEVNPATYLEQRDQWLPWLPNPEFKTFVGFQMLRITSEMRAEYNAELTRIQEFSGLPSRLACLYAWSSLEDARTAKAKMKGRFNGKIIRCTPINVLRAARCNSALVNFAQRAERLGFFTDAASVRDVWRAYWSGSGAQLVMERQNLLDPQGDPETVRMSKEPLWEWLIDGALRIDGDAGAPEVESGSPPSGEPVRGS